MKLKRILIIVLSVILLGVVSLAVYDSSGTNLFNIFKSNGDSASIAYSKDGIVVFGESQGSVLVPSGDLTASTAVRLPDLYEANKGFTCTGLAYDGEYFYIGDIGVLSPSSSNYQSQIVVTSNFVTVERTIPLHSIYTGFGVVQGVAYDSSNDSLWCVSASGNKVYNLSKDGTPISSFDMSTSPTGIVCDSNGYLWLLDYSKKIYKASKQGTILETYDFAYNEQLDQCFLDESRGLLYITAGDNYTSRNNVYCFNINTHEQSIACTVDSYAVEGIWLGDDRMIILNDGYYHSATVEVNQANIYDLS